MIWKEIFGFYLPAISIYYFCVLVFGLENEPQNKNPKGEQAGFTETLVPRLVRRISNP
jgi:hypothetical protein